MGIIPSFLITKSTYRIDRRSRQAGSSKHIRFFCFSLQFFRYFVLLFRALEKRQIMVVNSTVPCRIVSQKPRQWLMTIRFIQGRSRWAITSLTNELSPTQTNLSNKSVPRSRLSRCNKYTSVICLWWLASRVVSVLDSGAERPGFKSQPRRCLVTVLGKLFTPVVTLFTKQQNWYQPS